MMTWKGRYGEGPANYIHSNVSLLLLMYIVIVIWQKTLFSSTQPYSSWQEGHKWCIKFIYIYFHKMVNLYNCIFYSNIWWTTIWLHLLSYIYIFFSYLRCNSSFGCRFLFLIPEYLGVNSLAHDVCLMQQFRS